HRFIRNPGWRKVRLYILLLQRALALFILFTLCCSCLACDNTTALTVSGQNDCTCANSGDVLVERTASGELLPAKSCVACPARTRVLSSDKYTCASCPDLRMSMSALGACTCDSGYTITGRQGLGTQQCVS